MLKLVSCDTRKSSLIPTVFSLALYSAYSDHRQATVRVADSYVALKTLPFHPSVGLLQNRGSQHDSADRVGTLLEYKIHVCARTQLCSQKNQDLLRNSS
jgi:hypothetical protein